MTARPDALELLPCPFCGAGETHSSGQYMPPKMNGRRDLISWTVRHHCPKPAGVVGAYFEFRGREQSDAIAAWNRRVAKALASAEETQPT